MNPRNKKTLKTLIKILPAAMIALSLSSCGSNGGAVETPKTEGFQQGHGPFDENGYYVEKWADSPPKRRFVTSKQPGRSISTAKPKAKSQPKPKKIYTPPVKRAYTPPKPTYTPPKKKAYVAPKKNYTPPKKAYAPPKKAYVAPKKKAYVAPKKPTAKKITPKSKAPIYHRVVKGDTLYGLSKRYGASVSSIQTANGLKGSSISLGRTLIIPRR